MFEISEFGFVEVRLQRNLQVDLTLYTACIDMGLIPASERSIRQIGLGYTLHLRVIAIIYARAIYTPNKRISKLRLVVVASSRH